MTFFDRLKYYIDYKGETINSFTYKCGFSSGLIAKLIANKTSIGSDKLMKIFQTFPDLNPTWLLIGTGDMKMNNKEPHLVDNIITDPEVAYGSCKYCAEKERLIKDQAERIEELKDTIQLLKSCSGKRDSA